MKDLDWPMQIGFNQSSSCISRLKQWKKLVPASFLEALWRKLAQF